MLNAVLTYNLDLVAFAVLAIAATALVHLGLRRSQARASIGRAAWGLLIGLLALGSLLAHRAGESARHDLMRAMQGFPPTYAQQLQRLGHHKLTFQTPADDPAYLQMIDAEKRWLKVNPAVNDVYTFRRDRNGDIRFLVDSETDYNGNGVYDEEREQRTAIGEKYPEPTQGFFDAVDGKSGFDAEPYTDRWGTWVSAMYPLYDADGNVEAGIGVDFDASTWISTILLRRVGVLGFLAVAMAILIWSRGVISITRCEMARRREAEEAASQSRRRLQTILDHEPEGVIVCSADTTIRQINPSGMHLLELASIDGAIGRRFTSFAGIGRADGFVAWLQQIAAGQAGQFTMQLVGERGTERWVNLHGVPLRASDAPVNEVLLVARDITAARAAEIEREALQQQLVEASRQAGMADIATGVLHNVGNVLNTINISVHVLTDKLRGSRVPALSRAADLLSAQRDTLEAFLTADERGRQFPDYLSKTAGALRLEHEEMLGSIRSIAEGLDHIKAIVQSQQTFATGVGVEQSLRPAAVFEEALKLNIASCERHQVLIERDFHELPPASLDKHKTLQVLINLINNAKNAVTMAGSGQRRIFLRLRGGEMNGAPSVRFEVSDEGVGIEPHNMTRIFNMRFTTRADGHGFGLHSSANAAQEMGGNLTAHSEGAGRGATFVLELPAVKVKVAA